MFILDRQFHINQNGCSICCLLYAPDNQIVERVVVYGHGFGGHKGTRAAQRFAEFVRTKQKGVAVLCFDWPCHGDDARKKLTLEDCSLYLDCVCDYVRTQFPAAKLQAYATSFGGYLMLRYIATQGNPFDKLALRCPAIPMHEVLTGSIVSPEEKEKLDKGKDALVGFDRKIRISRGFLESLRRSDVREMDFTPWRDDILILHGTKDEIVPISGVEAFAQKNSILCFRIGNADHRFIDAGKMREAITLIADFLSD
ncbi:MAG: alpha/beta hydrolase [Clostridia bacterium]